MDVCVLNPIIRDKTFQGKVGGGGGAGMDQNDRNPKQEVITF